MVNSRKEAQQHLSEENDLLRGIVVRQNTSLAEAPQLRQSLAELSARNAQYVHQEARHREEIGRLMKPHGSGSASESEAEDSLAHEPTTLSRNALQVNLAFSFKLPDSDSLVFYLNFILGDWPIDDQSRAYTRTAINSSQC